MAFHVVPDLMWSRLFMTQVLYVSWDYVTDSVSLPSLFSSVSQLNLVQPLFNCHQSSHLVLTPQQGPWVVVKDSKGGCYADVSCVVSGGVHCPIIPSLHLSSMCWGSPSLAINRSAETFSDCLSLPLSLFISCMMTTSTCLKSRKTFLTSWWKEWPVTSRNSWTRRWRLWR